MLKHSAECSSERDPATYAWVILAFAFASMAIGWGACYSFGVFLNPLLKEFGWTRAMTTGATLVFHLLNGFFSVLLGRLVDKHGPRIIIPVFGILMGSGYILVSQTETLWYLYFTYGVIAGMGSAVIYVPFVSVVSRWFQTRRGMVMGILASATAVGLIVQPVAEYLISTLGWRHSYLAMGTFLSLTMLTAGIFLKLPSNHSPREKNAYGLPGIVRCEDGFTEKRLPYHRILKEKTSWILAFTYMADAFCAIMVSSHIVVHGIDKNIPTQVAVILLTAIGVGSILGKMTIGILSDSLGRKFFLVTMLILMGLALAFLPFLHNVAGLFVFAFVFGFAIGGYVPLIPAIIGEVYGLHNVGSALGFCILGASIGASVGPVLAGYVFDVFHSYDLAFFLAAGLAMTASAAASRIKPHLELEPVGH